MTHTGNRLFSANIVVPIPISITHTLSLIETSTPSKANVCLRVLTVPLDFIKPSANTYL